MATDFEPRRAEPGQEFGYTGNVHRTIGVDDEIPEDEGWAVTGYDPGEGDDPKETRTITRYGVQKTLRADDSGVVHPRSQEEVDLLDSFALPVARSAMKAEAEPKKAEASAKGKE
jgi:hypothetical protein